MKTYQIEIVEQNIKFLAEPLETITDAAFRNSIDYPYECLRGTCTRCICKLMEGRVSYGDSAMIFTDDEIKHNLVYACIAYPITDIKISLVSQEHL